jgi:hypothetical protein
MLIGGASLAMRSRGVLGWVSFVFCLAPGMACGPGLDLGSDILWSARHEGNNFDEWIAPPGGSANASPASNTVETSNENAHRGSFSAKLSINAAANGVQSNAGMSRRGILSAEAYYSAWYYLPRSVAVGTFWVISKFRTRDVVDDGATEKELFDLDLANLPTGEMTLRLYDHRSGDIPLSVPDPVVPVGRWFQVETFYKNAPDATGRVTYWLDGKIVVDLTGKATGPTPWVQWIACSVAEDLMPSAEVIFIDDAAISLSRVGPQGILNR